MKALNKDILIIGDDLVTTKDSTIRRCGEAGLINTVLIKANQIGSVTETLLATRTAKEMGIGLVVSHRSKSPNEVMEADIAFAVGALGLKCGGGANTERLVKYGRIVQLMEMAKRNIRITRDSTRTSSSLISPPMKSPPMPGIPTVGVVIMLDNGMRFAPPRHWELRPEPMRPSIWWIASSRPARLPVNIRITYTYNEKDKTYRFLPDLSTEK